MFSLEDADFRSARKFLVITSCVIILIGTLGLDLSNQTILGYKLPVIDQSFSKTTASLIFFYAIFAFALRGYEYGLEYLIRLRQDTTKRIEERIALEMSRADGKSAYLDGYRHEAAQRTIFYERFRRIINMTTMVVLDFSIPVLLIYVATVTYRPAVDFSQFLSLTQQ